MKSTDLRIGNLFNPTEPTKVEAWMLLPESKIIFEPIPLTEEWLLKFSFEKEENDLFDDWFDFTKGNVTIYYDSSKGHFIYLGTSLHIQHTHQLQNFYHALTGEELTINENIT